MYVACWEDDCDEFAYRIAQRSQPAPARKVTVMADRLAPTGRQRQAVKARHSRSQSKNPSFGGVHLRGRKRRVA